MSAARQICRNHQPDQFKTNTSSTISSRLQTPVVICHGAGLGCASRLFLSAICNRRGNAVLRIARFRLEHVPSRATSSVTDQIVQSNWFSDVPMPSGGSCEFTRNQKVRSNAKAKGPNAAFRHSWRNEPVQGAVGEPVVVFAGKSCQHQTSGRFPDRSCQVENKELIDSVALINL